jgi:hypothetical protein
MSAKRVGFGPRNTKKFDDTLCYSENDDAPSPGYDADLNEYYETSSRSLPEKSTSMKRRTRPTWQLIEDYKENLRLKRALEEIDSDPFVAG